MANASLRKCLEKHPVRENKVSEAARILAQFCPNALLFATDLALLQFSLDTTSSLSSPSTSTSNSTYLTPSSTMRSSIMMTMVLSALSSVMAQGTSCFLHFSSTSSMDSSCYTLYDGWSSRRDRRALDGWLAGTRVWNVGQMR